MAKNTIPDLNDEPENEKSIDEMQAEIFNTAASIEQNFWKNLKNPPNLPSTPSHSIEHVTVDEVHTPSTYEEALLVLSGIRDDIIGNFECVADNKDLARFFTDCITKIESGIETLGGTFEPFNPLSHISGLSHSVPEDPQTGILENAKRVVENTVKNYTLMKSSSAAEIHHNRPSVVMRVEANTDTATPLGINIRVVAKPNSDFTGNESIDYVRREGADMVSVRALTLGRWKDVSDRFDVIWQEEGCKELKRR